MATYSQDTIDAAIRLFRRDAKGMSDVRIDYAQWSDEARSSPIAFIYEFYSSTAYKCYFCGMK